MQSREQFEGAESKGRRPARRLLRTSRSGEGGPGQRHREWVGRGEGVRNTLGEIPSTLITDCMCDRVGREGQEQLPGLSCERDLEWGSSV